MRTPESRENSPNTPKKDPYKFDRLVLDSAEELGILTPVKDKFGGHYLTILRHEVLKEDLGKVIQIASCSDTSTLMGMYRGEHAEINKGHASINLNDVVLLTLLPGFYITALALKLQRSKEKSEEEFSEDEVELFREFRSDDYAGIRCAEIKNLIKPMLGRFSSEFAAAFH